MVRERWQGAPPLARALNGSRKHDRGCIRRPVRRADVGALRWLNCGFHPAFYRGRHFWRGDRALVRIYYLTGVY